MEPDLSAAEWSVLGLVAEGRTHGFAVAKAMAPDGDVGRVWSCPRPLVYRALDTLATRGLVAAEGQAPGARGPRRTLVGATPAGRQVIDGWLDRPAEHVRDLRSLLLLKLLFLERRQRSTRPLLEAQRRMLGEAAAALEERASAAGGFDATLALWRLGATAGALRFVETLLARP